MGLWGSIKKYFTPSPAPSSPSTPTSSTPPSSSPSASSQPSSSAPSSTPASSSGTGSGGVSSSNSGWTWSGKVDVSQDGKAEETQYYYSGQKIATVKAGGGGGGSGGEASYSGAQNAQYNLTFSNEKATITPQQITVAKQVQGTGRLQAGQQTGLYNAQGKLIGIEDNLLSMSRQPTVLEKAFNRPLIPYETTTTNTQFQQSALSKVLTFGKRQSTNNTSASFDPTKQFNIFTVPYYVAGKIEPYIPERIKGTLNKAEIIPYARPTLSFIATSIGLGLPFGPEAVASKVLGTSQYAKVKANEAFLRKIEPQVNFAGVAKGNELKVISRAEMAGQRTNIISKFKIYPEGENAILAGRQVSIAESGGIARLESTDVIAYNKKIGNTATLIKNEIVSNKPLIDNIFEAQIKKPVNDAAGFLSTGFSKGRSYATINTRNIGFIDRYAETPEELIKTMQKNTISKGSINGQVEKNIVAGFAKPVSQIPAFNQGGVKVWQSTEENIIGYVGGKAKMRIYKEGGISYTFNPKIKGYIKVISSSEDTGGGVQILKFFKKQAPLSTISTEAKTALIKSIAPNIQTSSISTQSIKFVSSSTQISSSSSVQQVTFRQKQSAYYGLGLYERTNEVQAQTRFMQQATLTKSISTYRMIQPQLVPQKSKEDILLRMKQPQVEAQRPREGTATKTIQIARTTQINKVAIIQATNLSYKEKPLRPSPYSPYTPKPETSRFFIPVLRISLKELGLKNTAYGGRKAVRYMPSFSALVFKIGGTYKAGRLSKSGIDFRPITAGFSFQNSNNYLFRIMRRLR